MRRKAPYPDRDGEHRDSDDFLLARYASDLAHAWQHRWGPVTRGVVSLATAFMLSTSIASTLFAAGMFARDFEDLPDRVATIENQMVGFERRYQSYIDTASQPGLEQVGDNTQALKEVQSELVGMKASIRDLTSLARSNNCWIRVAAQQESRFNCSFPRGFD